MNTAIQVSIRQRGNSRFQSLLVETDGTDTVETLKQKIGETIQLNVENMRIIFCGRRLDDNLLVSDLNLGAQT